MTFLEIAQELAKRLRRTQPAITTLQAGGEQVDLYRTNINSIKRKIEDSHSWRVNDLAIDVQTANGTAEYPLAGIAHDRFEIQQVLDLTQKGHLLNDIKTRFDRNKDLTPLSGTPTHFIVKPPTVASGLTVPRVEFYPTPTDVRTIRFYVNAPQADLDADSDVPRVAPQLVLSGAYAQVYVERGEAVSTVPLMADPVETFETALAYAIALDKEMQGGGLTSDFYVAMGNRR